MLAKNASDAAMLAKYHARSVLAGQGVKYGFLYLATFLQAPASQR